MLECSGLRRRSCVNLKSGRFKRRRLVGRLREPTGHPKNTAIPVFMSPPQNETKARNKT